MKLCLYCDKIQVKRKRAKYCSKSCSAKASVKKRKQTKLKRYGDENFNNREKFKQTNLEKYGTEQYLQSNDYLIKTKQTNLEKYGTEHYNNREKFKQTNLEKYGTEQYLNSADFIGKRKDTLRELYNNENYNNREKAKRTSLRLYGVEHYYNEAKYKETTLSNFGVEYYSQKHISNDTLCKLNNKEWLIEQHHSKKKTLKQIAFDLGDILAPTVKDYIIKYNVSMRYYAVSTFETYIKKYIQHNFNTEVMTSNRTIIKPYELDIYVPEYKLAIEYNGLYWHRPEIYGSKIQWFLYHQNKEELCNSQGIELLHLWENYGDHNMLIKNAIYNKINNNLKNIYNTLYKGSSYEK